MDETRPTKQQADLAEMLDLLLDKGVVVNADIAVTVGDTELLGVKLRAAVASFETAAKYGMEFPEGTDMDRVERAAGVEPVADGPGEQVALDELDVGVAGSGPVPAPDEVDTTGEETEYTGDEAESTGHEADSTGHEADHTPEPATGSGGSDRDED